jgi:hypothetical protein
MSAQILVEGTQYVFGVMKRVEHVHGRLFDFFAKFLQLLSAFPAVTVDSLSGKKRYGRSCPFH